MGSGGLFKDILLRFESTIGLGDNKVVKSYKILKQRKTNQDNKGTKNDVAQPLFMSPALACPENIFRTIEKQNYKPFQSKDFGKNGTLKYANIWTK